MDNTDAVTLWKSFDSVAPDDFPASIENIMDNWTVKNGYPVVTVSTVNATHVKLTQVSIVKLKSYPNIT